MNPPESRIPPDVQHVVMRCLSERLDAAAVSTGSIVKEVRRHVPQCYLTDEQLVRFVADKAVEAGFGVSFEGTGGSTPKSSAINYNS